MRENTPDIKLIEATKKGDSTAFDRLMLRYQPRILKTISKFVKDPTESLDISQEIFIKAYKAIDKFRADSSFYTWLYRIAINTSKSYILSEGRQLQQIGMQITDMEKLVCKNAVREHGTPERLMMRDQMENVVYDTIDSLPETLRTVITLREIDGLSYEEISDLMRCPVGTVRSRIFRARAVIDKNVQPLL